MDIRRRLPALLLLTGAVAIMITVPVVLLGNSAAKELPWVAGLASFVVAATIAAELEASRARLVRAQETERRPLERNIHDGVQQDLVALMGQASRVRSCLERGTSSGVETLAELQWGLQHVLVELRELAHAIHPSVLSATNHRPTAA